MATVQPKTIRLRDGTEAVLRSARESDAGALLEFARDIFRDGEGMLIEPDEFNLTDDEERSWIKALTENPKELVLVAEVQGRIVGAIDFHIAQRRRLAHSGHFGMSIQPDWRSRGLGNALLERLVEWARSVPQIEKISLVVRADNERAIALYLKHGFVHCGRAKNAMKLNDGVYVDDLSMERFV